MLFKNIHIKNYRNYKDINIDIANHNVFLGLNDVGKSNLLNAIRLTLIVYKNLRPSDFAELQFGRGQLAQFFKEKKQKSITNNYRMR